MARSLRKKMWMTNRRKGMWIPAPKFNADYSREGSFEEQKYANGGGGMARSTTGQMVYNLSWAVNGRDLLRPISDFASGVFGLDRVSRKPLPVWIVDPMAADKNVFNQAWGSPALAAGDALPLFEAQEPRLVPTPPNSFDYPLDQAVYSTEGVSERFFIPMPPDHTVWIGAHGTAGPTTGMQVAGVTRTGVLEPETLPMMGYSSELVSTPFSNPEWLGVEVSVRSSGDRVNLFLNPGFDELEGDKKYDYVSTGPDGQAQAYAIGKPFGGATRTSLVYTQELSATGPGNGIFADVAVEGGKVYSFGTWVWANDLTRMAARVIWYNAASNPIGLSAYGDSVRVPTSLEPWDSPVRIERSNVLAPSGAVRARVSFVTVEGDGFRPSQGLIDTPLGHRIGFAGLQGNEGRVVDAYHDGESPGWKWTGARYRSASRETVSRITLGALVAQVLPNGAIPQRGNFASGQGAGGCEFRGFPQISAYSAPLDLTGMSAVLVETQPWD